MTIDWGTLFPPYLPDTRGGKLKESKVYEPPKGGAYLLLCGPREVADQILAAAGNACREGTLTEAGKKNWTHAIFFPDGVPQSTLDLAGLLTVGLSIPAPEQVDRCMALDWYTVPDDGAEDGLSKTRAGEWIHFTKHASHPEWSNSRRCRREMVNALIDFIRRHPAYSSATAIIAAPGHDADGQSFGENLARQVAREIGIPYVESTTPGGARPAQFETKQDLSEAFVVQGQLSGTVVIVDDVYQSGGSATGAAAAARRAGASSVVFLAVARTIHK